MQLRRLSKGTLFFLFLVLPLSVSAVDVSKILTTHDSEVVSRGDFLRAAVTVFEIEEEKSKKPMPPVGRVPRALEPYVRIAQSHDALPAFGTALRLARPITRIEAVRLIVDLLGVKPPADAKAFRDIRGADASAAQHAVDRGWIEPVREGLFGARNTLTGKEARLLLRKVLGQGAEPDAGDMQDVQTIHVKVREMRQARLPKLQILESVWDLIEQEFLYQDRIKPDEAAFKALEGIVQSLNDPYTVYMRPVSAKSFQQQIQGEVSGIGAQVEYKDNILTIISPLKGSPAERAGLKPGDQILRANGIDLAGLGFLEAVDKVRGPKGTIVELLIRRDGIEFNVEVLRDTVKVPEVVITWQGSIAIVEIMQFGRVTLDGLRDQLIEVMKKKPSGMIVDLRNNPGGLLTAAISVVSHFLPKGSPAVIVRARGLERTDVTLLDPVIPEDLPLVILVNEGSASASEIVAGALQDAERATIVGEKTFGKGTVQEVLQFNDQSSLKMTVAEWFTPKGHKIDGVGVIPKILVKKSSERDEQKVKALEILR